MNAKFMKNFFFKVNILYAKIYNLLVETLFGDVFL